MKKIDKIYNDLVDRLFFTDEELTLITKMDGYTMDTLDRACYARFGWHSAEDVIEDYDNTWND